MTRHGQTTAHALYKKLLALYPRTFREQLEESMVQTFNDLYHERKQARQEIFGFVLWMFLETALGIFRERLLLITEGNRMQSSIRTLGSSGAVGFLFIIPFLFMEIVNRRQYNEDFPFALFFGMWLNLFAFSLILLPIVRGRWAANRDTEIPVPDQGSTLLTNPRSAALISIGLLLFLGLFPLLDSIGWISMDRLFNGPDSSQPYLPGQIMTIILIFIPIAAGVIAARPVAATLRAGGSLFAHPFNLLIVVFLLGTFLMGFTNFLIDQWPCFIGVRFCD
jgi:hypothetical protein